MPMPTMLSSSCCFFTSCVSAVVLLGFVSVKSNSIESCNYLQVYSSSVELPYPTDTCWGVTLGAISYYYSYNCVQVNGTWAIEYNYYYDGEGLIADGTKEPCSGNASSSTLYTEENWFNSESGGAAWSFNCGMNDCSVVYRQYSHLNTSGL